MSEELVSANAEDGWQVVAINQSTPAASAAAANPAAALLKSSVGDSNPDDVLVLQWRDSSNQEVQLVLAVCAWPDDNYASLLQPVFEVGSQSCRYSVVVYAVI